MGFSLITRGAERRLLQVAILLAGMVPVSAGSAGFFLGAAIAGGGGADLDSLVRGADLDSHVRGADLDSHVRYLSGLLLGIGLAFWWMVPTIERHGPIVRLLTFLVVLGGIGRLAGLLLAGVPSPPMVAALGMELIVTPLLCLWQWRVATSPTT